MRGKIVNQKIWVWKLLPFVTDGSRQSPSWKLVTTSFKSLRCRCEKFMSIMATKVSYAHNYVRSITFKLPQAFAHKLCASDSNYIIVILFNSTYQYHPLSLAVLPSGQFMTIKYKAKLGHFLALMILPT